MNKALILVLIAECGMTIGQICFKKSANHLNSRHPEQSEGSHPRRDSSPFRLRMTVEKLFLNSPLRFPTLWIGVAAMLAGLLFWLAALSEGELSYVYLLGSIQYIFVLFAAHFFLNEKINTPKLIGTLLITLGVILTAIS